MNWDIINELLMDAEANSPKIIKHHDSITAIHAQYRNKNVKSFYRNCLIWSDREKPTGCWESVAYLIAGKVFNKLNGDPHWYLYANKARVVICSRRQKFTNIRAFAGAAYGIITPGLYPKKGTNFWPN